MLFWTLIVGTVVILVLLMLANEYAKEHVMDAFMSDWEKQPEEVREHLSAVSAWLDSPDRSWAMHVPFAALVLYLRRGLWSR